jgi:hypothetical protein
MLRAFLSFQPVLNTVKSASQNKGQLVTSDSKRRGKRAKLKKGGKRGIGSQNKGSFAIGPKIKGILQLVNAITILPCLP